MNDHHIRGICVVIRPFVFNLQSTSHFKYYKSLNLKCSSGLVLLLIPNRKVKKAANIILLGAKLLNLYSHFAIDDAFERMAPTLVFFFMLVCRMVVDWQFLNSAQQVIIATYLHRIRNKMIRSL